MIVTFETSHYQQVKPILDNKEGFLDKIFKILGIRVGENREAKEDSDSEAVEYELNVSQMVILHCLTVAAVSSFRLSAETLYTQLAARNFRFDKEKFYRELEDLQYCGLVYSEGNWLVLKFICNDETAPILRGLGLIRLNPVVATLVPDPSIPPINLGPSVLPLPPVPNFNPGLPSGGGGAGANSILGNINPSTTPNLNNNPPPVVAPAPAKRTRPKRKKPDPKVKVEDKVAEHKQVETISNAEILKKLEEIAEDQKKIKLSLDTMRPQLDEVMRWVQLAQSQPLPFISGRQSPGLLPQEGGYPRSSPAPTPVPLDEGDGQLTEIRPIGSLISLSGRKG